MPRFKLTIEYAGTRYSGWQIQKNARTVQGELDKAVRGIVGRREFELYGAGRTDAGVHALGQVAHLEAYTDLPPDTLRSRINDALPSDIHVRSVEKVPHRFHARHDAVRRSYVYVVSRRRTALFKPYVWWVKEPVDLEAMRIAAAAFVGMKQFDSFTADEPGEKSSKVLIERVEIVESGALVLVRVIGSHFLWRMVRRMTGVLVAVGRGDLSAAAAAGLLDERSTTAAPLTAPSSGLFLEGVYYKGDDGPGPLQAPAPVNW